MFIGFRSFPDGFSYVVLDGSQSDPKFVDKERVVLPKSVSWPEALSWVRRQTKEILDKHKAKKACIKTIEPIALKKSRERLQIEALIQECLLSEKKIRCEVRVKQQMKKAIPGFTEPAKYLDRFLDTWDELKGLNTPAFQEATIAALSLLPEE